jgi:hypothetical protein
MRILPLAAAALFLASPAVAQPDCRGAQIQMDRASDAALTTVNQVMVQSNRFREIMQRSGDERKSQMRDFCHQDPFAKYDAARIAFDDGTERARLLRNACPAADQQDRANKAISRYTNMQANNEKMILRLRGACAAPG